MSENNNRTNKSGKVFESFVGCTQIVGMIVGILALIIAVVGLIWVVRNPAAASQVVQVVAGEPTSTPVIIVNTSIVQATTEVPIQAPTYTPYPTNTPYPTYTPYPTPTRVLPPSPTPTLSLILPFQDSFDGKIFPDWKILSGDTLIQDGWLSASRDSVVLGLGDDSLTDFTLDFDYKNLRGTFELLVTFDQKVRMATGQDGSVWQALNDNNWNNISNFGGVGVSGHLTINVAGNTYKVLRNQDPVQEITYGDPVGGPIMITIVADRFIDNFSLSQP